MRTKLVITLCLLSCLGFIVLHGTTSAATGDQNPPGKETFSALEEILPGGGTRNVTIYIDSYSSTQEAQQLGAILAEGGPNALLDALEKMKPIGRIERVGTVGFYDFKLILSKPTETGRRIYASTDRPIGFREELRGSWSLEYPFGILQLDLKDDKKGREEGSGTLIYAAKIKGMDGEKFDFDNLGPEAFKLLGVREL
jgi:hypothetical protein